MELVDLEAQMNRNIIEQMLYQTTYERIFTKKKTSVPLVLYKGSANLYMWTSASEWIIYAAD